VGRNTQLGRNVKRFTHKMLDRTPNRVAFFNSRSSTWKSISMADKKILSVSAAIAALIGGSVAASSVHAKADEPTEPNATERAVADLATPKIIHSPVGTEIHKFVMERSDTSLLLAAHSSHASHGSHRSHSSHRSGS
jgi:hypothetical protein